VFLSLPHSTLRFAEAFHINGSLEEEDFDEDEDCAPGSIQPVVLINDDGERDLTLMRWGFKLPDRFLFNVRSEEVAASKFWKDKFAGNRCIIPASSYFEWPDNAEKPKPKYEINMPGREYLGIAGVWAPWKNPKTDQWEKTFSTFTSEPNALIENIHVRQPVILEPHDFKEWLTPTERLPVHLLRVVPEEEMLMTLLNPEKPIEEVKGKRTEPAIKGWFD
jgi:putative SOS response-associated peptidase YedK